MFNSESSSNGSTLGLVAPPTQLTYQERKEAGMCTRRGCSRPAADDSNECTEHREGSKQYRFAYRVRQKRIWKAQRLCLRCGGRRRQGSKWCSACLIKAGKLAKKPERETQREISAPQWRERLEQSPDGKLRTRRRFGGQGKRGRQPAAQLDEQDRLDAIRCVEVGFQLLALYQSDEGKALPKAQRDDHRDNAVAYLKQAQRWLDEVIERNEPKSRKEPVSSEDD